MFGSGLPAVATPQAAIVGWYPKCSASKTSPSRSRTLSTRRPVPSGWSKGAGGRLGRVGLNWTLASSKRKPAKPNGLRGWRKPPQGFEPWTPALRKLCSTAELRRRKYHVSKLFRPFQLTFPTILDTRQDSRFLAKKGLTVHSDWPRTTVTSGSRSRHPVRESFYRASQAEQALP